jgi:hypothetical protein
LGLQSCRAGIPRRRLDSVFLLTLKVAAAARFDVNCFEAIAFTAMLTLAVFDFNRARFGGAIVQKSW